MPISTYAETYVVSFKILGFAFGDFLIKGHEICFRY